MTSYDPLSKKIGDYLIDAGLLDQSQVQVVLSDQKLTGLRFGDIAVNRGWVKKQTLEYVVGKVITFERAIGKPIGKQLFMNTYLARKQRETGSL